MRLACQNPELKAFIARAGKQSASFARSVVANKELQAAQLEAAPDLAPTATLTTKVKNTTRWLVLWEMSNRNRLIGPEICKALTGSVDGV